MRVAAQAAAAPMNGAVQGVDSMAVSIPRPKEPGNVSWLGLIIYINWGSRTEKIPHIPKAIVAMMMPIPMVKTGYWNS